MIGQVTTTLFHSILSQRSVKSFRPRSGMGAQARVLAGFLPALAGAAACCNVQPNKIYGQKDALTKARSLKYIAGLTLRPLTSSKKVLRRVNNLFFAVDGVYQGTRSSMGTVCTRGHMVMNPVLILTHLVFRSLPSSRLRRYNREQFSMMP